MKKLILLTGAFVLMSQMMIGQVKLTYEKHALLPGENNNMILTEYVDPGPGGVNQIWDFSELKIVKEFTGYLDPSSVTKNSNQLANANTALIEFGNTFYFDVNENRIDLYGYSSQNGQISITYDKPFTKMIYPFEYGNNFNGTFHGLYHSYGNESELDGTYDVEADAYGTLILPDNRSIENALRVKTIKSYSRVLNERKTDIEIVTHRWYSDNERYPLLVFISTSVSNGSGTSVSKKAAFREVQNVSTQDEQLLVNEAVLNLSALPNPYVDKFNLQYSVNEPGKISIEIFDAAGKKVHTLINKTLPAGNYQYEFDASAEGLVKGVYHIRAVFNDMVKTQKIIQLR